jgi:hypothetical protein
MSNRGNDEFQRALDEARRQDRALDDEGSRPAGGLRVRARLEFGPAPGSGGEARFGLALEWTDEPADRLGRQAPASTDEAALNLADTTAEIAAELGLAGPVTRDQLASRWRNFVWRNHPDRQPARERDQAGARVAIANALYDRARGELAKRR